MPNSIPNLNPVPLAFEDAPKYKFSEVPAESRVRVYGVWYAYLKDEVGNEFYITRLGWRLLDNLQADNWYTDKTYSTKGEHLIEGSGKVYRVPTENRHGNPCDLVVKFSRFAEAVPLHVAKTFPDKMPEDVGDAEFNDPFQEFGLLIDLRNGHFGDKSLRIKTKHPVAIFSPSKRVPAWKLGREKSRFDRYRLRAQKNSDPKYSQVELNIDQQYVYLFAWVKGWNAAIYAAGGLISEAEARELTLRIEKELKEKGFRVLDNKPQHIILREGKNGKIIRRNGEFEYALVDFELLQRTEEYEDFLREKNKMK